MKSLVSFIAGIIFSLGLGVSGMTQPHIVRGFLDVFGEWDWRLMGVMIGLKAFVAAVLGGIGNIQGAVLGGILMGLTEESL